MTPTRKRKRTHKEREYEGYEGYGKETFLENRTRYIEFKKNAASDILFTLLCTLQKTSDGYTISPYTHRCLKYFSPIFHLFLKVL